ALPVIESLLLRGGDSADPVIPWLLWWSLESKAIPDHKRVTDFFASPPNRKRGVVDSYLGKLIRRYAAEGTAPGYNRALKLLNAAAEPERKSLLEDPDRGLAERAVGLPSVGQGGFFDTIATPGAEPPKPRKYEPITPELKEFVLRTWRNAKS